VSPESEAQTEAVHEFAGRRLRDAEQMYTKGRRELVLLLHGHGRPATIPDLLDRGATLTQSSMYRNMVDLQAVGVVQKVAGADDRARYELAEELIGHHHHLICTQCGSVDDFVAPASIEQSLDSGLDKVLVDRGFQINGHRLDILGICAECA
jgi:Fur family transcriptional regulator, ferric uptake regulator